MYTPGSSVSGYIFLFLFQLIILIIYFICGEYDKALLPPKTDDLDSVNEDGPVHVPSYPHFQDIHVMIFVGFAFLMTFLKKYGYSATGFNLFAGGLMIQWAVLCQGFFSMENGRIPISLDSMINGDIAAATVLISMGALLGRVTPIQLLLMGIIEIAVFAANEHLQVEIISINDVGGSITVHAYGAYFGLAVSLMLMPKESENHAGKYEGPSYVSDTFAMIGTLFLWIFWPSFNSALLDGSEQQRAILNTYLSLAAATVTTFVFSVIVSHEKKLDMVHIQNSTLAGGVAVGSVCNLMIGPGGAVLVGILSGILSVFGYRYLTPLMTTKLRIHDTCGVHNLHGMPAVLSGILSGIYAAVATKDEYQDTLTSIFPAMKNETELLNSHLDLNATEIEHILGGYGRTTGAQGGYQILGTGITIVIALVAGAITGLFLRSPSVRNLEKDEHHDDEIFWEVPVKDA